MNIILRFVCRSRGVLPRARTVLATRTQNQSAVIRPASTWVASFAVASALWAMPGGRFTHAVNTADIYTGSSTGSLLTAPNWNSGAGPVPTVTHDAIFDLTAGTRTLTDGNLTVGSFNVTATTGTFGIQNNTATATNSNLTLGGAGNLGNGVSGTAADLLYVASGTTFNIIGANGGGGTGRLNVELGQNGNFNVAGTMSISSVISDGGNGFGFTKTGVGTLTLLAGQPFNGLSNTFTGAVVVDQGTLVTSGPNGNSINSTLGSASSVTINNGGTVRVNGDNSFTGAVIDAPSGARFTQINAGGTLQNLGSFSNHLHHIVLNGGTISAATANGTWGNWNFDFGVETLGNGTTSTISGGNATLTQIGGTVFNVGAGDTLNVSTRLDKVTGHASTGLIKTGAGLMTLSGVSNYTGVTKISEGVLSVAVIGNGLASGNLGASSNLAANLVFDGGTLRYTGANASTDRNFTITAGATAVFDITQSTTTLNLSGGSANTAGGLTKTGAGTLQLTGSNSHTGLTTVWEGVLAYASSNRLSTGPVTVNGSTASLQLSTNQDTVGTVTLAGGGSITSTTGTLFTTGTFEMHSGSVSAILGGPSAAMNKTTAGTVTLFRANTFGGLTTVSAGTLAYGISNALSAGGVTVNGATAVLALGSFTDTVGTVTVAGGGSITGSGTLTSTGTFEMQNGSVSARLAGSGIVLNKTTAGTVTLSGNNLYSGATTISNGTLEVTVNNALGTNAAGTSVSAGAALKLSNVIYSTTEALSLNGTGVGNGGALVNSGTSTYAGQITAATNASINAGGGTLTLTGGLVKNGTTLTLTGGGIINVNTVGISGSSANSDLVVDGTTANLNTANTYNGPTYIRNGGTINANVTNALPTANGRTAVIMDDSGSGSSTLAMEANQQAASLTSATTTSSVNFGSTDLTVGSASGTTTFAGSLIGSGGLVKDGGSTQVLSGSNSYSGTTNVSDGTLKLTNGSTPGNTTAGTVVNSGGVIELGGTFIGDEALSLNGSGKLAATAGTTNTWGGVVTVSNSEFDIGTGGTTTLTNQITGVGGITKLGGGELVLGGSPASPNDFTGQVTVQAGTLTLDRSAANTSIPESASGIVLEGGTLLLGQANQIGDTRGLTLDGGTFATGGFSETLGTLTLTSDSVIDFGSGASVLQFADSSSLTWTGTLSIWNWSGNPFFGGGGDQLLFGPGGLQASQASQIAFYTGAGTGFLGTGALLSAGEAVPGSVVPVPEPTAVLSALLLLITIVWRERGAFLRCRQARGDLAPA